MCTGRMWPGVAKALAWTVPSYFSSAFNRGRVCYLAKTVPVLQ